MGTKKWFCNCTNVNFRALLVLIFSASGTFERKKHKSNKTRKETTNKTKLKNNLRKQKKLN